MNGLVVTLPPAGPTASRNDERGRSHVLPFIFWLLEQRVVVLLSVPTGVALLVGLLTGMSWLAMVGAWLAVPLLSLALPLVYLISKSRSHDAGAADWRDSIVWRKESDARAWLGKKIPMEVV